MFKSYIIGLKSYTVWLGSIRVAIDLAVAADPAVGLGFALGWNSIVPAVDLLSVS